MDTKKDIAKPLIQAMQAYKCRNAVTKDLPGIIDKCAGKKLGLTVKDMGRLLRENGFHHTRDCMNGIRFIIYVPESIAKKME